MCTLPKAPALPPVLCGDLSQDGGPVMGAGGPQAAAAGSLWWWEGSVRGACGPDASPGQEA